MAGEHQMGSMDISEHKATWAGFVKYTIWGTALTVVVLALLAIFVV